MSLVDHARRELELLGTKKEDPEMVECLLKAVEAFAEYGHSGGSASWAIPVLNDLLQFKNLSPLTDNPMEWMQVGTDMWQSTRRADAFSPDKGKTYYLLSEGANSHNQQPRHESERSERT